MIKAVLFDLDGTLLPMEQDDFTKAYFNALAKKLAPHGYDPKSAVNAVLGGVSAMLKNDGTFTNEDVFWKAFGKVYGDRAVNDRPIFDDFYTNEFNGLRSICGFMPQAGEAVKTLKARGYRLVLASNPVFPVEAHKNRMRWAGVDENDFEYITSYENSHYCKPDPRYYTEIADMIGCSPEECVMVGNDVSDDMSAVQAGMQVFLMPECLINTTDKSTEDFRGGGFSELLDYLR